MTLAEQFPDISMLIRAKNKLNLKYNAARLFKDIRYMAITPVKSFYDKEIRKFRFELVSFVVFLLGTLCFVLLNAHSLWK